MMSNGWSSHLLRNTERQWGHASVTCSPLVHDRMFTHQLPVFILQWWWHLSTNALPERGFQGHQSPELLACPTCSPQADSHSKQSFVFRCECREDKGGTPTCLLLHPTMKKIKTSCLKKYCLPFLLHSSLPLIHWDWSIGFCFFLEFTSLFFSLRSVYLLSLCLEYSLDIGSCFTFSVTFSEMSFMSTLFKVAPNSLLSHHPILILCISFIILTDFFGYLYICLSIISFPHQYKSCVRARTLFILMHL